MAVITISRQFGAGGLTLGRIISKKLKYTFADSEVIQMIAKKANVSPGWVESVEKEAGSKFSRLISSMVSMRLVDRVLKNERGYIDEKIYLDYLVVIISQIAEEGNAVILGRGSQYILNDHPDVVHILLIDEIENRIKFMMEHYKFSKNRATQVINNEDKRRKNLYAKLGKEDYDHPELYHMVLNMSKVNLNMAAKLIYEFIE